MSSGPSMPPPGIPSLKQKETPQVNGATWNYGFIDPSMLILISFQLPDFRN